MLFRSANGKCDVLKGQCIRSNAGLYYDNYPEFAESLRALERNRWLAGSLGRNGQRFFREHYDWPVIERKYLEMFERLSNEDTTRTIEALPGWFSRRRRDLPPAEEVLATLPRGPALGTATAPAARTSNGPAFEPIARSRSAGLAQRGTRP